VSYNTSSGATNSGEEGTPDRNEVQYGLVDKANYYYYDAYSIKEKNIQSRGQPTGGKKEFNRNVGISPLKEGDNIVRDDGVVREFNYEYENSSITIIKYGDITFTLDLDPYVVEINADKDRMTQVLSNIIQNAIKFTEVGNITIKTRRHLSMSKISIIRNSNNGVSMTNRSKPDTTNTDEENYPMVEIEISDNGPRIPEDIMESLFEKFVTRDHSRRPTIHGTGLGLFICKSIVDYHGGTIKAWNNENGGATFSILLPSEDHLE
jgi:K+-sensing histidine kinase KdpD